MAVLDEYWKNQILTLQNDLKELSTKIEKILVSCAVRHRLDISSEIVRLETEIKNISKECQGFETTIKNNEESTEKNKEKLNELTGRVNILALKVDEIIEYQRKIKDNKSNFIMQILIIVIASLITALITFIGTLAWSGVKQSSNNHNYRVEHKK